MLRPPTPEAVDVRHFENQITILQEELVGVSVVLIVFFPFLDVLFSYFFYLFNKLQRSSDDEKVELATEYARLQETLKNLEADRNEKCHELETVLSEIHELKRVNEVRYVLLCFLLSRWLGTSILLIQFVYL